MTFRIVSLPTSTANAVRETLRAPGYGHPAHVEVATGHGPCRHCLRVFRVGVDRRILFTYDPFHGTEPLPLPGPIFIHEAPCPSYPVDGGFPEDLRTHALTLSGYGSGRVLLRREFVSDGRVEPVVGEMFARPALKYIHVRDTAAGCWDLTIERQDLPEAEALEVESCARVDSNHRPTA